MSTPRFTLHSGSLPPGLSLDLAIGAITGIPSTLGTYPFAVRILGATQSLSLSVVGVLAVATETLPAGLTGTAYSATLSASLGLAPYVWDLAAGSLPDGLTLSSAGVISGTPTEDGTFPITVRCTDALAQVATRDLGLAVAAPDALFVGSSSTGHVVQLDMAGATEFDYDTGHNVARLAWDGTALWAADYVNSLAVQLDPDTGAVLGTAAVGTNPGGICYDPVGYVWTANYTGANITKVNATTRAVIGSYATTATAAVDVAADDDGNIWVSLSGGGGGKLNKFTAADGTRTAVLDPYFTVNLKDVCVAGAYVWALVSGAAKLCRIHRTTHAVTVFNLPHECIGLAYDGTWLWAGDGAASTAVKLDLAGTVLGSYPLGGAPLGQIVALGGYVWFTLDAAVVRVTPADGTAAGPFATLANAHAACGNAAVVR